MYRHKLASVTCCAANPPRQSGPMPRGQGVGLDTASAATQRDTDGQPEP
jgi:hypothetical protein